MDSLKIIRAKSLEKHKARTGLIFAIPFIAGFALFYFVPLFSSLYYGFFEIKSNVNGMSFSPNGWQHFKTALLTEISFRNALFASLSDLFTVALPVIIYSFFIAIVLNQKFPGRTLARVIFFLPVVLNCGVMYNNMNDVFVNAVNRSISSDSSENLNSMINLTYAIMNLLPENSFISPRFIFEIVDRIYTIVTSSGIQILIYLAGLQTIPLSLYEASSLEGATAWENFWKITFPMLSPLILVNTIYTLIDTMCGFQNLVMGVISRKTGENLGLASAMSWIYLLLILALLGIVYFVINRAVFYEND